MRDYSRQTRCTLGRMPISRRALGQFATRDEPQRPVQLTSERCGELRAQAEAKVRPAFRTKKLAMASTSPAMIAQSATSTTNV